jgi:hypothetical protein
MITPEAQCSHYKSELLSILPTIIDDPAVVVSRMTTGAMSSANNVYDNDNITASSYVYQETHPDISKRSSVASPRKVTHSLTYSLTHSLTHSLTYSFTCLLTYSLTRYE